MRHCLLKDFWAHANLILLFIIGQSYIFAPIQWDWGTILGTIGERATDYGLSEVLDDFPKLEDARWMHGNAAWVAKILGKNLTSGKSQALADGIKAVYFNYYNFERFLNKYTVLRNRKDFERAVSFLKAILANPGEREEVLVQNILSMRQQALWENVSKDAVEITCERLDLLVSEALHVPMTSFAEELRSLVGQFQSLVEGLCQKLESGMLPELKKSFAAQESFALDFAWEVVVEIRAYGKGTVSILFDTIGVRVSGLSFDNKELEGWVLSLLFDYYLPAEWLLQLSRQSTAGLGFKMTAYSLLGELAECCSAEQMLDGAWFDKLVCSDTRKNFIVQCLVSLAEKNRSNVKIEIEVPVKKCPLPAYPWNDIGN